MTLSAADRDVLLTTLAPRIEGIVERTVQRTKASLEVYAELSEDELRDGITADLGRALAALVEQRELTDADRAGMSQIGDARAREGIPLEAMLQVYRFTIDEIFAGLWAASDEGDVSPEAAVRLTRLIWRYADPMMEVAIQAYRRRELEQAVAESQGRTALVLRLLITPSDAGGRDALDGGVECRIAGEPLVLRDIVGGHEPGPIMRLAHQTGDGRLA